MQKIILTTVLFALAFSIRAQVLINLQLPQAGIHVKSQLWNMTLVNTGTEILNLKIDMTMTDIATGQAVLSAGTRMFTLSGGAKQIQLKDLVPVQYNVLNNAYAVNNSPDGFLPVGSFTVCFSILKKNFETIDKISEECETIEVEPASPPVLITPGDLTETDQGHPLFNWLAPSPAYLFNNLSYAMKLVEVVNNQSPDEAVQRNIPVFYQSDIAKTSLLYPNSFAALQIGKTYAWQVVANNNGLYAAKSEVWSFKVSGAAKTTEASQPAYYYKLLKGGNASTFISDGFLKLEYVNENNDSTAQLVIYTYRKKKIDKVMESIVKLHFNQNLIDLDLREAGGLKKNALYNIELMNSAGEIWSGRFEFKPTY